MKTLTTPAGTCSTTSTPVSMSTSLTWARSPFPLA
jgi:hypothetical protein